MDGAEQSRKEGMKKESWKGKQRRGNDALNAAFLCSTIYQQLIMFNHTILFRWQYILIKIAAKKKNKMLIPGSFVEK